LREAQVEVVHVPRNKMGRVDLTEALRLLGKRGLTRIFCEGGPGVAAALIGQGLADEVLIFTAPERLGRPGVPGLDSPATKLLDDPERYRIVETRMVGADRLTRHEGAV
jgi:diaminohydroxyphosphoribosylaminopyrimidine deaminase/5-amino-6-(5-phosphoribosylamino)uracil reductase